MTPVAVGPLHQQFAGIVIDDRRFGGEAPLHEQRAGLGTERLESEQRGSAEQRRIDLEERILGGGADQDEQSALDRGQQCVLLRLVEPMHLIEEQDRALAPLPETIVGAASHLEHILHRGGDGRELLEGLRGGVRDELRQRGLTRARRPPQDHRRQSIGLDECAQRPTRAEQMFLTDDIVEGARPQPGGEWRLTRETVLGGCGEEVVGHGPRLALRRFSPSSWEGRAGRAPRAARCRSAWGHG